MSASTSESHDASGNRRIKTKSKTTSSGWIAFDLKQRRKQQGLESQIDSEAYPLLVPAPIPEQSLFKQNGPLLEKKKKKPFSSVLVASTNYPSLMGTNINNFKTRVPVSNSSLVTTQNINTGVAIDTTHQKLNYLHPWADESLVQDVLAAVNNNFDEALSLLETMLVSENKDANNKEVESNNVNGDTSFGVEGVSLGEKASDMSIITNDPFNDGSIESVDEASSRLLLDALKNLPVEPEPQWEEDDVYLIHRKDAIRMIRSASCHSKAANDAYLRGDHLSAHRFSLKAQEEWTAAEKLNAEAAKAILTLKNPENDLWTVDLHGLHAVEAVQALRHHLQTVESLVSSSNDLAATLNGVQKESGMLLSASAQSMTHVEMGKSVRQHPSSSRQRPKLLQVITGKGNHSRGVAALPSAIRYFLSENGYHFDETRPGVIMIRPKFRLNVSSH
ncbi:hypothetical protein BUALT_Bualt04G0000600 [Buddleja alternifolia]|uniref:Smr domain-containing protein n=1 Tax=Buddleja alternifolia TaxID=168488 RepID=A0AAV6XLY9_9LAMI|nr:hypothetical protein BUALT_Bualt04G0000600 [Buddleja alternifolia]